mmetsp:Transcript_936/g.2655  ORF Transcript_936/g.2655 Transcript_936/m.2655 type:complete len:482 (-) Transcript_936:416-1861(-)
MVKRKPIDQKRREPLLFRDGIPPLQRAISESGPSVPSAKEHAPVVATQQEFGLAPLTIWNEIQSAQSYLIPTRGHKTVYSSENDIAGVVKVFLTALIRALDLEYAVEIHSEVGTFNIRPDVWVVTIHGIPVGVIEVKKPDIPGGVEGLKHPNVLGELYDLVKHLTNFYGVTPAFGIVTNLNCWRMAWIPDKKGHVDRMAAECTAFEEDDDDADTHVKAAAPSHEIHGIIHDNEQEDEDDAGTLDTSPRSLHVSKIFAKDDISTLVRAIISMLDKMLRSRVTPFASPFDHLRDRTILKFVKGTEKCVFWTRLVVEPQWDKVARPKKFLFAVADLGRGAHGRVWLTTSSSGSICVLKFMLSENLTDALNETAVWRRAYPEFGVFAEVWSGRPCIRMPHFGSFQVEERASRIELVRSILTENFAQHGLKHKDVHWRNIGAYRDHTGSERAVVFDMGSVEACDDASWVDEACNRLLDPPDEEAGP